MADDLTPKPSGSEAPASETRAPEDQKATLEPEAWRAWPNLWQVPTIIFSVLMITIGVYVAMHRAPGNDFDGALDYAEQLLAAGELEAARRHLHETIEPSLALAADHQQARFHVLVGDWVVARRRVEDAHSGIGPERVGQAYGQAMRLGMALSPLRLERWAEAAIEEGDLAAARARLSELEAMSVADASDPDLRLRRNRVLRRLVEQELRRPEVPFDELIKRLDDYRRDEMLVRADLVWAVAAAAELRLDEGRFREAVDRLLVDFRRIEDAEVDGEPPSFARLHTLLGWGYEHLGELDEARYHVTVALEQFRSDDPYRGEALVLRGRLALAEDDLEAAFESFDEAVRDFAGTRSHLPALLGRADVLALQGDPDASLDDYRALVADLVTVPPRRDLPRERVARALLDRHYAALVSGRLALSLDFIEVAERLFSENDVPPEVLLQLALANRQSADNLLGRSGSPDDTDAALWIVPPDVDPQTRQQALRHYERAGDYAVRHARAIAGQPGADQSWADSLWLGAESYDLAGHLPRAIAHYADYVADRPTIDSRRPRGLLALARALQADMRYEEALGTYERLRAEHATTLEASRSHVPMARTLIALERRPEAEQLLQHVLSGDGVIEPDAAEYRDALIELGRIHHEQGKYAKAIERLREALDRYPDDARVDEVRFRLADSLRGQALQVAERLDTEPGLTPLQAREQRQRFREDLTEAEAIFGAAVASLGARDHLQLDRREDDLLRYSSLYQADCAFALGDFERALGLYEQAVRRYRNHYASMNALVQLVNCYSELGDLEGASAAHERALARLRQLPDEAFQTPEALMDREAWGRWLKSRPPQGVQAVMR